MFAKLFGPDERQIIVMRGENDDGEPAVTFFVRPPGLGLASACLTYKTEEAADRVFAAIDEAQAVAATAELFRSAEVLVAALPKRKGSGGVRSKVQGSGPRDPGRPPGRQDLA